MTALQLWALLLAGVTGAIVVAFAWRTLLEIVVVASWAAFAAVEWLAGRLLEAAAIVLFVLLGVAGLIQAAVMGLAHTFRRRP